ncbi:NADase-type glycan-binding domain-containing protein [Leptospira borgpetersenii]|uniref:NADase-type glycan-binding domain-containing protein n=1 Tax=Leptospira borgpetersenii TaxID=174 RepID=UPI00034DB579|nr:hypothetical protein [Leptospira borgpetersenii]URD69699.1 hypothetical protein LIX26_13930 [Leptospira borgpetersenii]UVD72875.1 hypothetical protein NU962_14000 [Leptospira borgpetersenii]UVD76069.1 hypothetical protein LIX27_14060 [Leptospira borgpetersenii]UZW32627.1 hypothetical protein OR565_14065 [Leptospira borgpetersenii]
MRKFIILNILIFASIFACEDKVRVLKKVWNENGGSIIASSTLSNQTPKQYSIDNSGDANFQTAWCTDKGPKGESIAFMGQTSASGLGVSYHHLEEYLKNYKYEAKFLIHNGYGKSEETYYNNNRIKKAKLKVYEAGMHERDGGRKPYISKGPSLIAVKELEFGEKLGLQIFDLEFDLKGRYGVKGFSELKMLYVFEIVEVYKGKKYNDTCISELDVLGFVHSEDNEAFKKRLASFEKPNHH